MSLLSDMTEVCDHLTPITGVDGTYRVVATGIPCRVLATAGGEQYGGAGPSVMGAMRTMYRILTLYSGLKEYDYVRLPDGSISKVANVQARFARGAIPAYNTVTLVGKDDSFAE